MRLKVFDGSTTTTTTTGGVGLPQGVCGMQKAAACSQARNGCKVDREEGRKGVGGHKQRNGFAARMITSKRRRACNACNSCIDSDNYVGVAKGGDNLLRHPPLHLPHVPLSLPLLLPLRLRIKSKCRTWRRRCRRVGATQCCGSNHR